MVYVADEYHHLVRKIGPTGTQTIVAGTGVAGTAGDQQLATTAPLNTPSSVAVGANGTLYIADTANHRVHELGSDGKLRVVAGNGTPGFSDGADAREAALSFPMSLAVDGGDNLYIATGRGTADPLSFNRIRKVVPADAASGLRSITTVAGGGSADPPTGTTTAVSATSVQLNGPQAVAVDSATGALYITDYRELTPEHLLLRVDAAGMTNLAGTTNLSSSATCVSSPDGPALTAQLCRPIGVAVGPAGKAYFTEAGGHRVRRVEVGPQARTLVTVAGLGVPGSEGDGGAATQAQLNEPSGLAFDSDGNMYIADTANYRVRKVDTSGVITTIAGTGSCCFGGDNGPATDAQLGSPSGVATGADGDVFIADTANHRIRKVNGISKAISTVAGSGTAPPEASVACAVAGTCGANGDGGQANLAWLNSPKGVAVDPTGALLIADTSSHRVRKVAPDGGITTVAGNGVAGYGGDGGPGTEAQLNTPSGVAVDPAGNVLIADTANHRVRRLDTTGVITTVVGTGTAGATGDGGNAIEAELNAPLGVALDRDGNLYIADTGNDEVRKVTTVGSAGTIATLADGFVLPRGVAVDGEGTVFVADAGDHKVKRIDSATAAVTTIAGTGEAGMAGDGGPARFALLNAPGGLAVAGLELFVADTANNRIRRVELGDIPTPPNTVPSSTTRCTATTPHEPGVSPVPPAPPGAWAATAPMCHPRHSHTATRLADGKVLVAGGSAMNSGTQSLLSTAEIYDPTTGTWAPTGSMESARSNHTATLLGNGKVLVTGGGLARGVGSRLALSEVYDPARGIWTATETALSVARSHHTATLVEGGWVLIAGGEGPQATGFGALASAELYDPLTNAFVSAPDMTIPRSRHTATVLGSGEVLVAGGGSGATAEIYDPSDGPTGRWRLTGPLITNRSRHVAAYLGDSGGVLVAGGTSEGRVATSISSAEVYEPETETWRSTESMSVLRAGKGFQVEPSFTATSLAEGGVLIAGGGNSEGVAWRAAEIYEPATDGDENGVPVIGAFRPTGDMVWGRWSHSATMLANGKVLVAGGGDVASGVDLPVTSVELYDPTATAELPSVTQVIPPGGSASGGTKVTIIGAGLLGAGPPTFGGVASPSYRVESPTRVVATSPPHTEGTVAVAVATTGGSSAAIPAARFTYGTWSPTASMETSRRDHSATRLADGEVLVTGGRSGAGQGSVVGTTERYDPVAGRWQPNSDQRQARYDHSASLLEGPPCQSSSPPNWCNKVLAAGGVATGGQAVASAEIYEAGPGTWSRVADMGVPRAGHTASVLPDGDVLVVGGADAAGRPLSSAERYDPDDSTWASAGGVGAARTAHTATVLDGQVCRQTAPPGWCGDVLVVGGADPLGSAMSSVARYDPTSRTWTIGGSSLNTARAGHSATALSDGRVLVAGGGSDIAEIYDPDTLSWTPTGRLAVARRGHSATLLKAAPCGSRCGKVVVAGGADAGGNPLSSAELYDPVLGTWAPTEVLVGPRTGHTVTALADGSVAAIGGFGPPEPGQEATALGGAEVYLPVGDLRPPRVGAVEPAAGPTFGGTVVTISGIGLSGAGVQVRFGEMAASALAYVSDTEVVAISPPQAQGRVPVSVVVPERGASPASLAAHFTFSAGTWAPITSRTASTEPLSNRAHLAFGHTATLLDGTNCRRMNPRPWCGRVLIVGGRTSSEEQNSAVLYDPGTMRWSTTGAMSTPRVGHSATLLDGAPCLAKQAPSWCGKVLVVGGGGLGNDEGGTAELYDPELETWTRTAPLTPRSWHSASLLLDGGVLVAGGSSNRQQVKGDVIAGEVFDPDSSTWTRTSDLLVGRAFHSATVLQDGKVLIVGGTDPEGGRLATTELWDSAVTGAYRLAGQSLPAAGSFVAGQDLTEARFAHTATMLDGPACRTIAMPSWCGTVLVAGGAVTKESGSGIFNYLSSAEIYDPAAPAGNRWSPAGVPAEARAGHSAIQLDNGSVLLAGRGTPVHEENGPPALSNAEIYDPAAREWRLTGPMHGARGLHSATLLSGPQCGGAAQPSWCGSVLAVGGTDVANNPFGSPGLATAEIYTPTPTVDSIVPSGGPVGTKVTIEGTGFSATSVPMFGTVSLAPGTFSVDSPTRITATAPPHPPGRVEVAVANPAGSSATLAGNPAARFTFVGLPGQVGDLVATAISDTEVELGFSAPAYDAASEIAATRYVIKQSRSSIDSDEAFDSAFSLCGGDCAPDPAPGRVGDPVRFVISGLRPGTTYSFGLRPLNEAGAGPRSNTATITTTGVAPLVCADLPAPAPDQIAMPGGYSLVGLPDATTVAADGPLYSWFDAGARGSYAVSGADQALVGGRGYWAWFRCPRLLSVPPIDSAGLDLPLGAYHASMVANPSGTTPASVSGHDFAASWDPGANNGVGAYRMSGYRQAQSLAVGQGTWVFSYEPTTIALQPVR